MSQQSLRTDEEILSEIREKFEYYNKWAQKYKAMLDAAESVNLVEKVPNGTATKPVAIPDSHAGIEMNHSSTAKSLNTEYYVLEILKDGIPRRTKELLDEYLQLAKPEQAPPLKDFSARIIGISKRNKTFINIELSEFKRPYNFWWGLADWFSGPDLKPEYLKKIREKMNKLALFQ